MKRNQHNQVKRASRLHAKGSQVYRTTIYPNIDRHISDIYIEALSGDRLDSLAYMYYEDVTLWWVIAQANGIGKGTMNVEPGQIIRIPNSERISAILESYFKMQKERL
jgi:hypothetical protein